MVLDPALSREEALQWISRAVDWDESQPDAEDRLNVPLEQGRLYDPRAFAQALSLLDRGPNASANSADSRSIGSKSAHQPLHPVRSRRLLRGRPAIPESSPTFTMAPVVLSGLIAASQSTSNTGSLSSTDPSPSLSSFQELVFACQTLRSAALQRLRHRKRRRTLQRRAGILILLSLLALRYQHSLHCWRRAVKQLGYVDSCHSLKDGGFSNSTYELACRIADAALWDRFGDGLVTSRQDPSLLESLWPWANRNQKSIPRTRDEVEAPYALHSTLTQTLITRDRLNAATMGRDERHPLPVKPNQRYPLQWLGESTVNRLVRRAVQRHIKNSTRADLQILDVGCGVGGTLYALTPLMDEGWQIAYRGIAASAAEVYHAQQLWEHHKRSWRTASSHNITFAQHSFDDALPIDSYSVIVAIESLSYSRNLKDTLASLLPALRRGGILIVVDDVAFPSEAGQTTEQPSLITHAAWQALLQEQDCSLQVGYDLTLEYELLRLTPPRLLPLPWTTSLWMLLLIPTWTEPWLGNRDAASRRLVNLQQDAAELIRLRGKRDEEYINRQSLSYQMYSCVKQF